MKDWPSTRSQRVLAALLRIGWSVKRQSGSHRVNAGANQADGPSFSVSDEVGRRERAYELAYQDARARASKLAAISGKSVGEVVCIAEGGWPQGGGAFNFTEAVVVSAAPVVEEGREEVAFNLSVVFELK